MDIGKHTLTAISAALSSLSTISTTLLSTIALLISAAVFSSLYKFELAFYPIRHSPPYSRL